MGSLRSSGRRVAGVGKTQVVGRERQDIAGKHEVERAGDPSPEPFRCPRHQPDGDPSERPREVHASEPEEHAAPVPSWLHHASLYPPGMAKDEGEYQGLDEEQCPVRQATSLERLEAREPRHGRPELDGLAEHAQREEEGKQPQDQDVPSSSAHAMNTAPAAAPRLSRAAPKSPWGNPQRVAPERYSMQFKARYAAQPCQRGR